MQGRTGVSVQGAHHGAPLQIKRNLFDFSMRNLQFKPDRFWLFRTNIRCDYRASRIRMQPSVGPIWSGD